MKPLGLPTDTSSACASGDASDGVASPEFLTNHVLLLVFFEGAPRCIAKEKQTRLRRREGRSLIVVDEEMEKLAAEESDMVE